MYSSRQRHRGGCSDVLRDVERRGGVSVRLRRGTLAMPDSGGRDYKKYDETIGRLEGLLGLWIAAVVLSSYVICVFCMLAQCRA